MKDKRRKDKFIIKEKKKRAETLEKENYESHYVSVTSEHDMRNSYPPAVMPTSSDSKDSYFDENDWTPFDSSYGGAFPCCGWIPKRIRQSIEYFLLVLASFTMIYFLVSAAIILTGSGKSGTSSTSSSSTYYVDDDKYTSSGANDAEYIAYTNQADDMDDLFNEDEANDHTNYYNAGGGQRLRKW
eukprot:CAMPEP_0176490708 /NCGR_PEP_ID=MMETSP0200_2-20121128/8017_1 /TAXON_ID=947934 /ORGANISM="Chaetoceros sp., Strain GSL56" /LENGTH=184 /DNA_ID=CAMNT_0017888037 /DNA_START=36 /DNA_END=587 /DNA_ORIENTATION=-